MPWADLGVVEDFPSKPQCLATPLPILFPWPPSDPTAYLIKTITGWLIPKEVPGPEKSSKNSFKNGLLAKSILSQAAENKHCFFPGVGKPYIVFWGLLERADIFFFSGKRKLGLLRCSWDCFQPQIQDLCCSDCISPSQVHTLGLLNVFTRKSA